MDNLLLLQFSLNSLAVSLRNRNTVLWVEEPSLLEQESTDVHTTPFTIP